MKCEGKRSENETISSTIIVNILVHNHSENIWQFEKIVREFDLIEKWTF